VAERIYVTRTFGRRAADTQTSSTDVPAVLRTVLVVLAVIGSLWVVYQLGTLIVLLVFAVLFAYLLAPLVALVQRGLFRIRRSQLRKSVAITIAYLVFFGAVVLTLVWVTPRVTEAAKQLPQRIQSANLQERPFQVVSSWLQFFGISGAVVDRAVSAASNALGTALQRVADALLYVASYLPWLVLIPILAFFFLKDAQTLTRDAIDVLPERWQAHAPDLLKRIDDALSAYIRAQLVASLIVGVVVGLGFTVLRVPFTAVFAVAAGIAEFVPIVGPLTVAVVAGIVALLHSPLTALWVVLFLGALRVVEDYVIYPRLIGSHMHLHPLAVILAVLAGGELGGVVGVLLSVPFLAIAWAVYNYISEAYRQQQQHANRLA
jgi:predicted PurR-regulated permease PerM